MTKRLIYLECNMGAAGDMMLAALVDLMEKPEDFIRELSEIFPKEVRVQLLKRESCGVFGRGIRVLVGEKEEESEDVHSFDAGHGHTHGHDHSHGHDHPHGHGHDHTHDHSHGHDHPHDHGHDHAHHSFKDVREIIGALPIEEEVKEDAISVYRLLARAEGQVHEQDMESIHFHEVGNMDAITDIVSVCLALHRLGMPKVFASPVHVGSGFVRCSHGILPVPAPATSLLLEGIPTYSSGIKGELCTPTGAALLRYFVREFLPLPLMKTAKIGIGVGKKRFSAANILRAFWGEVCEPAPSVGTGAGPGKEDGNRNGNGSESGNGVGNEYGNGNEIGNGDFLEDRVWEISVNIDDSTPEKVAYIMEELLVRGALDVWIVPIQMKKNRAAHMLTCLCFDEKKEELARYILRDSTAIGLRLRPWDRMMLVRREETVETEFGKVRVKVSGTGEFQKIKPAYEDMARICRGKDISPERLYRQVQRRLEKHFGEDA